MYHTQVSFFLLAPVNTCIYNYSNSTKRATVLGTHWPSYLYPLNEWLKVMPYGIIVVVLTATPEMTDVFQRLCHMKPGSGIGMVGLGSVLLHQKEFLMAKALLQKGMQRVNAVRIDVSQYPQKKKESSLFSILINRFLAYILGEYWTIFNHILLGFH